MENISINKTFSIIILVKGAFPLDRHKKKIGLWHSQKQTTKAK